MRKCRIKGCHRPNYSLGFCVACYRRQRRNRPKGEVTIRCSAPGCDRQHYAHKLCNKHLSRMQRFGSLDLPPRKKCGVQGCKKDHSNRGYCRPHARRFLLYGSPIAGVMSLEDGPTQLGRQRGVSKQRIDQVTNPAKHKARAKLKDAVDAGRINRPTHCSRCGKRCKPDGHHDEYSQPLKVVWLCSSCHRINHKQKRRVGVTRL